MQPGTDPDQALAIRHALEDKLGKEVFVIVGMTCISEVVAVPEAEDLLEEAEVVEE